jgi:hypothetical protein
MFSSEFPATMPALHLRSPLKRTADFSRLCKNSPTVYVCPLGYRRAGMTLHNHPALEDV